MRLLFPLVFVSTVLAEEPCERRCYMSQMIACSEANDLHVDEAYNVFVQLLSRKVVSKGDLRYHLDLTRSAGEMVYISRAFYLTPNVCRGFQIGIPRDCFALRGDLFVLVEDIAFDSEDAKQGVIMVNAKRAISGTAMNSRDSTSSAPNKSLQPTATAVMPPACAGVTPALAVAEH
jgi:hypothetical protein